jgi:hypothetical protein
MSRQVWYEKSFRRNLVDMHIDSWNEEFLSQFDPEVYFHNLKKANIQSPMIYTHSHVGYCNWPSESGEMHPGFKGENKIKRLFDLCHTNGMDVIAYYSLIYNNWAYSHYPEWRMKDVNGIPSRGEKPKDKDIQNLQMMIGQGRYGLICPNTPEYREFLIKQFKELCGTYEFEAIFLDMTFWPMVCYCDNCRRRFREETGLELPETIDWKDETWIRFQKAREDWMSEFAYFATSELKKLKAGLDVEHQFSTGTHSWTFGVRQDIADASDYVGGDLYGGFEQQSFICKLYYGITRNHPFEYMTSRCDPSLHDHTTTKSNEMLKLHAYLTYAHHGAFLAIDAIDPRGTINEKFYDVLGDVFNETKKYENFFTGELSADVAVYFSLGSKMDVRNNIKMSATVRGNETYQHLACSLGAGKALRKAHIPYRVITEKKHPDIMQNKVIVLSDIAFMAENEQSDIIEYVKNGGCVYISGITAPEMVKKLINLDITGMTKEIVTYIRPDSAALDYFCEMYTERFPMTIFGKQMLARDNGSNETIARITLPYTDPQDLSVLASIHSNPPGIDTDYPSIVCGKYGKGTVIWSAAPFESSEQPVHKQVFINLINRLLSVKPMIISNAPRQIEFTVFDDSENNQKLIHCVNLQEEFPMIKLQGFNIEVRSDKPAKSVQLLPSQQMLKFENKDGYVKFTVSDIDIFQMYSIKI